MGTAVYACSGNCVGQLREAHDFPLRVYTYTVPFHPSVTVSFHIYCQWESWRMCTLSIWGSWGLAGLTLKVCCGQRLLQAESHVALSGRASRCSTLFNFCRYFTFRGCGKENSNVAPQEWSLPQRGHCRKRKRKKKNRLKNK